MAEIRVKHRDHRERVEFATAEFATIVVEFPRVYVLDVEADNFAAEGCILLPESRSTTCLSGLGVLFAVYLHLRRFPEHQLFLTGHALSDAAPRLGETRLESLLWLLQGARDDWRKHAADHATSGEVRAFLQWQAYRDGWDCSPTAEDETELSDAVRRFQRRYNQEVDRAQREKLDLPFATELRDDGDPGPKTWGAFFDVFQHALMRELEIEAYGDLRALHADVKTASNSPGSIHCAGDVPFESAKRLPFAPREDFAVAQRKAGDTRLEILFVDPSDAPDLRPYQCGYSKATCPLYALREADIHPLGQPKGLGKGEVNIALCFADPEDVDRYLPEGLAVTVEFGSGGTQAHVLGPDGLLRFMMPKGEEAFSLRIEVGEDRYLTLADPSLLQTTLSTREEALQSFDDGGRWLRLRDEIDMRESSWRYPSDLTMEDGAFVGLSAPDPQVGERGMPAVVSLDPAWQHFAFRYYDRWSSEWTTVPATRLRSEGTAPLVLEGYVESGGLEHGPTGDPEAESQWDIVSEGGTLLCLAWVRTRLPNAEGGEPKPLPSATTLTRFVTSAGTFLRTNDDGEPPTLETVTKDHPHDEEVTRASVDRLRYYDLPEEWWSLGYYTRFSHESRKGKRLFETIAEASSATAHFVIELDDIVLGKSPETLRQIDFGAGSPPPQRYTLVKPEWEKKEDRVLSVYDHELEVFWPAEPEQYFTDLEQLDAPPVGSAVLDYPQFTRLLAHKDRIFDVFEKRTDRSVDSTGVPVGARLAFGLVREDDSTPFTSFEPAFCLPRPNGTKRELSYGDAVPRLLLRCCGREDASEVFRLVHRLTIYFRFDDEPGRSEPGKPIEPPLTETEQLERTATCLLESSKRWRGGSTPSERIVFQIGAEDSPHTRGYFHALLVRGESGRFDHDYEVRVLSGGVRASMARTTSWDITDLTPSPEGGRFVAAHEFGHGFGLPDQYVERAKFASLGFAGIRDGSRSPGCPYARDTTGMMVGDAEIRARDFWHHALWLVESGAPFDGEGISIRHGRYLYKSEITSVDKNRAYFPIVSKTSPNRQAFDIFAYETGVEAYTAGENHTVGGSEEDPYGIIVVVEVKFAVSFEDEDDRTHKQSTAIVRKFFESVEVAFSTGHRLWASGVYRGEPTTARVIFEPRVVVRDFPKRETTGDSPENQRRSAYLRGLSDMHDNPEDSGRYQRLVDATIESFGIHVDLVVTRRVDATERFRPTGRTVHATARKALLHSDALEIFSEALGLPEPGKHPLFRAPFDYQGILRLLEPEFKCEVVGFSQRRERSDE